MTKQSIFDRVWNHLVNEQKRGSFVKYTTSGKETAIVSCRYRTEEGMSCAAGCLLPDEHYAPSVEGRASSTITYFETKFSAEEGNLIRQLQRVHDYVCQHYSEEEFLEKIQMQLERSARLFRLEVPKEN